MDRTSLNKVTPSSESWKAMMSIYYSSFEPRVIRCDVDDLVAAGRMDAFCLQLGNNKILLESKGDVIGTALVRSISIDESSKFALVEYLAIDSNHRSKGFGTALIDHLKQSLGSSGHQFAVAEIPVFGNNVDRRNRFYAKSGWMSIPKLGAYKMPTVDNFTNKFSSSDFKDERLIFLPLDDNTGELIDQKSIRNAVFMMGAALF